MSSPLLSSRGAIAAAGALLALVAVATVTASHADSMQSHETMATHHPAPFWFGAPGKAADADRTIRVRSKDISFDPPALQVKAGETVRFVVTNASENEHEFTLGDTKTQRAHRAEMADMAAAHAHDDDPNAVFLKGGETKEIIWRFAKAGRIEFACNVPGHYESGMKGTIAIR